MKKSYFAILEVTSNATPDQVHSAYRRLAKAFHPDHYEGGSEPFKKIQEAYSVLGDPAKRKAYEKTLPDMPAKKTAHRAPYPEPEPLIPERRPVDMGEISPIRSFETVTPSLTSILRCCFDPWMLTELNSAGIIINYEVILWQGEKQLRRWLAYPSLILCCSRIPV